MSDKKTATPAYEVAGLARVDLLPPEIRARAKDKVLHRWLVTGIILAGALVALGFAGTSLLALQSQQALESEQERTLDLLAQQQEFIEVRKVQGRWDVATAAERVGASSELDWKTIIEQTQAALPAGVTLSALSGKSATPTTAFEQSAIPLQGPRIAGVSLTASSPSVPDIPTWISSLRQIPGVTNVVASVVTQVEGAYTVDLTVYLADTLLVNTPTEEDSE